MTVNEAKRKIHWHVRDSDSVRPEPYSSPAAAKCSFTIRGEPMPGFRVVKIGLCGACPCRSSVAASGVQRQEHASRSFSNAEGGRGPKVATDSVSSHRKVQTPEEGGDDAGQLSAVSPSNSHQRLGMKQQAGAAPAAPRLAHEETNHLHFVSGEGYGG